MTKQNTGAYTVAGLLITIWASRLFDSESDWRGRFKMTMQFAGGIAIPVIPTLLWLMLSGAGSYLYESWVYYPLIKYPTDLRFRSQISFRCLRIRSNAGRGS